MPILNIQVNQPGQAGVFPNVVYILTNDTISEVTAAGYLNKSVAQGFKFSDASMALVTTKTSEGSAVTSVSWLEVSKSGDNWSLVPTAGPGSVTLPTIANHIATYTNTTGGLSEDSATAINGGNVQAGLSGTAGYLASFPGTASKGSLRLTAVANTGDTLVTISNALHGQASVYSIPDVGAATGQFLVKTAALVSGNFPQNSGTGGVIIDSGVAVSALQLKANIKAAVTGNIGGAGGGPISVAVTGMTSSSIVVATIAASSNAVSVVKAVAGSGSFNVTFSADPGASCTLNYIAFIVAQ